MKKLVLFAVAAVAISFASCGNKAAENASTTTDSVATTVAPTTDSVATTVDSTATATTTVK